MYKFSSHVAMKKNVCELHSIVNYLIPQQVPPISSVDVPKAGVLLVREIIETVDRALSGATLLLPIPDRVLPLQVPPQEDNDRHQEDVAAHVGGKGNEVPRLVPVQEDLGSDGITSRPPDEVHGDGDGALGLAGHVSGNERHGQVLRGPERQHDVIGEQEADFLSHAAVFLDRHEDDGADEGRDDVQAHDEEVLARLLDEPGRGEQDDDNDGTEDHGEELGLETGEAEVCDDEVGEGAETRCG